MCELTITVDSSFRKNKAYSGVVFSLEPETCYIFEQKVKNSSEAEFNGAALAIEEALERFANDNVDKITLLTDSMNCLNTFFPREVRDQGIQSKILTGIKLKNLLNEKGIKFEATNFPRNTTDELYICDSAARFYLNGRVVLEMSSIRTGKNYIIKKLDRGLK